MPLALEKHRLMPAELLGRALHYLGEAIHPSIMPAVVSQCTDGDGAVAITIRELGPQVSMPSSCAVLLSVPESSLARSRSVSLGLACNDQPLLTVSDTLRLVQGSLKDLVYKTKAPLKTGYCKKYGTVPKAAGIDVRDAKAYGRQILEGLKFLHDRGIPYGHLHSGNVIVRADGSCALSDVESGVLGIPGLYSHHITQLPQLEVCAARMACPSTAVGPRTASWGVGRTPCFQQAARCLRLTNCTIFRADVGKAGCVLLWTSPPRDDSWARF